MIGAKELAALPKGAVVVNTGRGQVLDFDALNDALESDQLFAAAIDAYFPEPLPPGHPLLRNPKTTLSPHIAGTTVEASLQLACSAADQILTALVGGLPAFPVNRAAWDGPKSRRPKGV
jgi:D-3-phosphoglycerate dehydrogenase